MTPTPGGTPISSDLILRILEADGLPPGDDTKAIVDLARASRRKILPTLLSAWRAEGRRVSPALAYELDLQARRIATYKQIDEDLSGRAALTALRGLRVARLYPRGVVRQLNDLDYLCTSSADLWAAARHLVEAGWEVYSLSLVRAEGALCPVVRLQRESADPDLLVSEAVELTTVALIGDFWSVPARRLVGAPGLGSWTGDLLLLAAEGLERAFCARDAVDVVLLLNALDADGVARVREGLEAYELWRPWAALARRVRPLDAVAAGGGDLLRLEREPAHAAVRRRRRASRRLLRPAVAAAAYGQRALMTGRDPPLAAIVRRWSARLVSSERALEAGLPLFGLRIGDDVSSDDEVRFARSGSLLTARTPLGRFAFVAGDEVPEDAVNAGE